MKGVIECAAWFLLIVVMLFLFKGDPDLFDKLRERAMKTDCISTNTGESHDS